MNITLNDNFNECSYTMTVDGVGVETTSSPGIISQGRMQFTFNALSLTKGTYDFKLNEIDCVDGMASLFDPVH